MSALSDQHKRYLCSYNCKMTWSVFCALSSVCIFKWFFGFIARFSSSPSIFLVDVYSSFFCFQLFSFSFCVCVIQLYIVSESGCLRKKLENEKKPLYNICLAWKSFCFCFAAVTVGLTLLSNIYIGYESYKFLLGGTVKTLELIDVPFSLTAVTQFFFLANVYHLLLLLLLVLGSAICVLLISLRANFCNRASNQFEARLSVLRKFCVIHGFGFYFKCLASMCETENDLDNLCYRLVLIKLCAFC